MDLLPDRERASVAKWLKEHPGAKVIKRWEAGCCNALQLWREVREQGYPGCATAVRDFVVPLRQPGMTPAIRRAERAVPSPRALSWLLALPERRTAEQTALAERICAACPPLLLCRDLVLSFQEILGRRAVGELDGWLEDAEASDLPAFAPFVRGIRADIEAVRAAFTLEWSNRPTEGHVNRVKFLKRQGYGRAGFDLLRRRVLPLAA